MKIFIYIFLNLIYLSTNIIWYLLYGFIIEDDYKLIPDFHSGILILLGSILSVWVIKLSFFPVVYTIFNKLKVFTEYLDDIEDNIEKQNSLMQNAFVFDSVVIICAVIYAYNNVYRPDLLGVLLLMFLILILCGGGVFISYVGLILWLAARKITFFK